MKIVVESFSVELVRYEFNKISYELHGIDASNLQQTFVQFNFVSNSFINNQLSTISVNVTIFGSQFFLLFCTKYLTNKKSVLCFSQTKLEIDSTFRAAIYFEFKSSNPDLI